MKLSLLTFLFLFVCTNNDLWLQDYEQAVEQSNEKDKPILLVFSGSDWCKPCIRLKEQVLETTTFSTYAKNNLVLLAADFPRKKKNHLPTETQIQNGQLAEKYNPNGYFPYAVLLNKEGKLLKVLDTDFADPNNFIKQLK